MTPEPGRPGPPPGFAVRHRPAGGRWRTLAVESTRAAAVARMFDLMARHRGGGWHVTPAPPAGPPPAAMPDRV